MKHSLIASFLFFTLSLPPHIALASSPNTLDSAVHNLLAKRSLAELSSAEARRSIRGTKALWVELSMQAPARQGMESLEADLRLTDLEGQLRGAGFKVMDPKRRSLALGLRPTLLLMVQFVGKGSEGNSADFYLVTVGASQDVVPLGGEKLALTTWMKVGEPIDATGDAAKDGEAIRASARACVLSFIHLAQDKDDAAPAKP